MNADEWGAVIEHQLLKIWTDALSDDQRHKVTAAFQQRSLDSLSDELFAKLDSIILHQAQTLGWRITLSELVRLRMSQWDHAENGPELFRKLGSAFARLALIVQRRELPPVDDPDQWAVKQETVRELRLVLRMMRGSLSVKRREPVRDEVLALFSSTVSESSSFPHLSANRDRWLKFFDENRGVLRPLALGDRPAPASLYDEFHAWSTGWEIESLRQATSLLKPKL